MAKLCILFISEYKYFISMQYVRTEEFVGICVSGGTERDRWKKKLMNLKKKHNDSN